MNIYTLTRLQTLWSSQKSNTTTKTTQAPPSINSLLAQNIATDAPNIDSPETASYVQAYSVLDKKRQNLTVKASAIIDAYNLTTTASDGLKTQQNSLLKLKQLFTLAQSKGITSDQLKTINKSVTQELANLNANVDKTTYQNVKILGGNVKPSYVETNPSTHQGITISLTDTSTQGLGIDKINTLSSNATTDGLNKINSAIHTVAASIKDLNHAGNQLADVANGFAEKLTNITLSQQSISGGTSLDLAKITNSSTLPQTQSNNLDLLANIQTLLS